MHAGSFCVWVSCSVMVLAGGTVNSGEQAAAEAPVVPVAHPVERQVTDYEDFTGRTDAAQQVELRARVSGYLIKVLFKDGAEVKKGDVLFEIDPRPYLAQLDQAQSQLSLQEASLKLAKVVYDRDQALSTSTPGSVSKQQLEQDQAAVEEAQARLVKARASTVVCQLNLAFTKVTAPIDGRIGKRLLDPGSLVLADNTVLATIVSEDPICVNFDIDERTLLLLRRSMNKGKIKVGADLPVLMELEDEKGFPHRGTVDFMDNHVDAEKGTIRLRAVFSNPKPETGVRLLSPGMFVRVRLAVVEPHKALLVADSTLTSDHGLFNDPLLWVVDAENKVQSRRVKLGQLEPDGLYVVLIGLKHDDWVVVGDLKDLRPNLVVKPEKTAMPTVASPADTYKKLP